MKEYLLTDFGVTTDSNAMHTQAFQHVLDLCRDGGGASINFMYANAESFTWPTPTAIFTFTPEDTFYEQLTSWYDGRVSVWNAELDALLESYNG